MTVSGSMWVDQYTATQYWPEAGALEESVLDMLLLAAQEQCEAYAPFVEPGMVTPPFRYALATIYQARELYRAGLRDEQDVIGVGDYAIRARPLTAAVKQLLRPERRVPAVG